MMPRVYRKMKQWWNHRTWTSRFLLGSTGIYALLLLLVTASDFNRIYTANASKLAQQFAERFGESGQVGYAVMKNQQEDFFLQLTLTNHTQIEAARAQARQAGQKNVAVNKATVTIDPWSYALFPTLFVLSLALGFPASWQRKLWSVPVIALLFHLYLVGRIKLDVWYFFGQKSYLEVNQWEGAAKEVLGWGHSVLFSTTFNLLLGLALVLLVLMQKQDWRRLVKREKTPESQN